MDTSPSCKDPPHYSPGLPSPSNSSDDTAGLLHDISGMRKLRFRDIE